MERSRRKKSLRLRKSRGGDRVGKVRARPPKPVGAQVGKRLQAAQAYPPSSLFIPLHQDPDTGIWSVCDWEEVRDTHFFSRLPKKCQGECGEMRLRDLAWLSYRFAEPVAFNIRRARQVR